MDSITHSFDALKNKHGVNVMHDTVTAIDAAGKKVTLKSGKTLSYDRLVVSPGIDFKYDTIEGYSEKASVNGSEFQSYAYWVDHNIFTTTTWKSANIDSSIGQFEVLAHIDINIFPTQLPTYPPPNTMFQDTDPLSQQIRNSIEWGGSLVIPLQGGGFAPDFHNWRLELGAVDGNRR